MHPRCAHETRRFRRVHQGIVDTEILAELQRLAARLAAYLEPASSDSLIVLSGAGTSGRLAFMCAQGFNCVLQSRGMRPRFCPLVAGGEAALLTAREGSEDDWRAGVEALVRASDGRRVLYIGITCGLSAPVVAGQLLHCLEHSEQFIPALIGFNPVSMARTTPIEGCECSFFDVAARLRVTAQHGRGHVLCPVVGPEALTGSTRLKGGTATKILLECLFIGAMLSPVCDPLTVREALVAALDLYACAYRQAYMPIPDMAQVLTLCGESLRSGRCICYLSDASLALVGLADAAECPPTFGADPKDVRCYEACTLRQPAADDAQCAERTTGDAKMCQPQTSTSLLDLDRGDTLLLLRYMDAEGIFEDPSVRRLLRCAVEAGVKLATLSILPPSSRSAAAWTRCSELVASSANIAVVLSVDTAVPKALASWLPWISRWCGETAAKLVLNVLSTGAHVLRGKVYGNRMIDMRVCNDKLFRRAVLIVAAIAGVSTTVATRALLESIYGDGATPELLAVPPGPGATAGVPISAHVRAATGRGLIVPVAILIASGYSRAEAVRALQQHTGVRAALAALQSRAPRPHVAS